MDLNNSPKANDALNTPQTFGMQLKRARLDKNVSLDEAAAQLFILKRHLQALEEENFNELPQAAFARGFALNYARYLGLDQHNIATGFDNAYPEHLRKKNIKDIESPLRPMGTLQRGGGHSWRINPLLIIGLILLIGFAIFVMRVVVKAQQQNSIEDSHDALVTDLSNTDQAAGAFIASNNMGDVSQSLNNATANINPQPLSADSRSINTSAILDFWVQADTNISVIDATDAVLMEGTQHRGAYRILGKPPFQIQIDRVDKVSLNINQNKVRLADYTQNNSANFTLPLS